MKIKKFFSIILIIAVAIAPYSCNDSFLDLHNKAAISDKTALTTIADMEVALNGVYSTFRGWAGTVIITPDLICDDFFPVKGYSNSFGGVIAWDYGADDIGYVWGTAYVIIIRADKIINKFDEGFSEGTQEQRNHILGQALLARAMAHFELVRAYSKRYNAATASTDLGVPIIRTQTLDYPARNSVQEVYDFIFEDINRIMDENLIGTNENVKFTNNLVYAFLSRVYLEMGNNEKVIEYSSKVIESGDYKLAKSEKELQTLWTYDEGDEIIWRVGVTTQDGGPALGAAWNTGQIGNDPRPDYVVSPATLELFDKKDYRYDNYFMNNVTTASAGKQTILTKYPTNPDIAILNVNMPKLYRIAEQYLNRAEAYEAIGNTAAAQADLDAILTARNAKAVGDGLRNQIRTERRKELIAEGFRYFDLRRWGEGFTRITNDGCIKGCETNVTAGDHRWVMPIPAGEMIANENMVQNEGYE